MSSLLKIAVSLIIISFSLTSAATDPYHLLPGAGEAGMGYVCVMKNGYWSSFHNQASLGYNDSFFFGFNYENRFSVSELATRSACIVIPSGKASMGAVYSHFGYDDFRRNMVGLASGIRLGDKIAAGIQLDYFTERASGEYYNYQSVTCETGILITPNENLRIGIHVFNPIPGSFRKYYMPVRVRAGVGSYLNKTLFAGMECEMTSGSGLVARAGFEYEVARNFRIRSGFSTENNAFSFGLGWVFRKLIFDLGFVNHERLGLSSSASMVFKIK